MLDARYSHLYFCQSLNRLQRGLSAIADLLVLSTTVDTAEEEGDPQTPGKGIWSEKCGQLASETAEERWRQQNKTEPDGVQWSVALASMGATRYTCKLYN